MNNYLFWKRFAQGKLKTHVSSVKIRIPSPKEILSWSERRLPNSTLVGKIDNAHTVEHDTLRPVSGGLFCERIFGPISTNVCACLRRKGWNEEYCKICEVQFTKSRLRRYQMGHISLAAPVIHIWALQGGYLSNLLGKKNLGIRSIAYGKVMCQSKLWDKTLINLPYVIVLPSLLCTTTNKSKFVSKPNLSLELREPKAFFSSNQSMQPTCYGSATEGNAAQAAQQVTLQPTLGKVASHPLHALLGMQSHPTEGRMQSTERMQSHLRSVDVSQRQQRIRQSQRRAAREVVVVTPISNQFSIVSSNAPSKMLCNRMVSDFYRSAKQLKVITQHQLRLSYFAKDNIQKVYERGNVLPFHQFILYKPDTFSKITQFFNSLDKKQTNLPLPCYSRQKLIFYSNKIINKSCTQLDNLFWKSKSLIDSKKLKLNQRFVLASSILEPKQFSNLPFDNKLKITTSFYYDELTFDFFLLCSRSKAPVCFASPPTYYATTTTCFSCVAKPSCYGSATEGNAFLRMQQIKALTNRRFVKPAVEAPFQTKSSCVRNSFVEAQSFGGYLTSEASWNKPKVRLAKQFTTIIGSLQSNRRKSLSQSSKSQPIGNKSKLITKQIFGRYKAIRKKRNVEPLITKTILSPIAITNTMQPVLRAKRFTTPLCTALQSMLCRTCGLFGTIADHQRVSACSWTSGRASLVAVDHQGDTIRDFGVYNRLDIINWGIFYFYDKYESSFKDRNFSQPINLSSKTKGLFGDLLLLPSVAEHGKYALHPLQSHLRSESMRSYLTEGITEGRFNKSKICKSKEVAQSPTNQRVTTAGPKSRNSDTTSYLAMLYLELVRAKLVSQLNKSFYYEVGSFVAKQPNRTKSFATKGSRIREQLDQKAIIGSSSLVDRKLKPAAKDSKLIRSLLEPKVSVGFASHRASHPKVVDVRQSQHLLPSVAEPPAVGKAPSVAKHVVFKKTQLNNAPPYSLFGSVALQRTNQPLLTDIKNVAYTGSSVVFQNLKNFNLVLLDYLIGWKLKKSKTQLDCFLLQNKLTKRKRNLRNKLAKLKIILSKRKNLVQSFLNTKQLAEWMIISILPILPPALRPILELEPNNVVVSDLNVLYQTVIRRNDALMGLLTFRALEIDILNRQVSLQQAIEKLFDKGAGTKKRPVKSLSQGFHGKKGLFRSHLLGKRVDYSGRSVIVVGPQLKLHECGLPKEMALVLFLPFLIARLKKRKIVNNTSRAKQLILRKDKQIWSHLKSLIYEHPVLLNRAPTLHRLGFQAFQPILVSGKAMILPALVCTGFNADFDGDQMAVHVPLSHAARAESWKLLHAKNNMLSPATGKPIIILSQEMILGCYCSSLIWNNSFKKKRQTNSINSKADRRGSYKSLISKPLQSKFVLTTKRFGSVLSKVRSKKDVAPCFLDEFRSRKHGASIGNHRRASSCDSPKEVVVKVNLYFTSFQEIYRALGQNKISIQTAVWLRIPFFEDNQFLEEPLEIRLDAKGHFFRSYCQSQRHFSKNIKSQNQLKGISYIRTSAGRIQLNETFYSSWS